MLTNTFVILFKCLHNFTYVSCGVMHQLKVGNLWALQKATECEQPKHIQDKKLKKLQKYFQRFAIGATCLFFVGYMIAFILIVGDKSSQNYLEYISFSIFLLAALFLGFTTYIYCKKQFELYGDTFQKPITKVWSITVALVVGYVLCSIFLLVEAISIKKDNLPDTKWLKLSVTCTFCQILPLCVVMGIHLREMYFNRQRN